ncbi:MAG: cytochrome [Caulobacteraceae bacterium]|nr:cytochrome [Caulobacteraceae bacterium]
MLAQCPVSHDFNPFSADYMNDPHSIFAKLRADSPVTYVPELKVYVVSRYEDVAQVLEDRETFCSEGATSPFMAVSEEAQAVLASGFHRKPVFSNCDPPKHPKMRLAASRCLTLKRWDKAKPAIREYAEDLIARMSAKPVADLMDDLCFPLPAFAGFTLLGFPREDTELLKSWCNGRVGITYGDLTPPQQLEAAHDLVDFFAYCHNFVELRKKEPADDLTSDLLELSKKMGAELTSDDIVNMIYSISLAGHETSTAAIMNGMQKLLSDRAQWDRLRADPSLIPNAVEELMRWNSPTLAVRRLSTRESTIGDVVIPKGSRIYVLLASANRDEDHFPDPEVFDMERENARDHVSFGKAWHFCLGAPLARYEYELVLELLTQRTPDMQVVEGQETEYVPNILIRKPEHLLVKPNVAAAQAVPA